ncbi:hypothetical protein P7F60_22610 [Rhizobium sp. YJ-22]|uniref:DUF6665 family protein n=1 Tax=Rhizobium sp. YJ-22 TaxID=3037556 RepID=UPI001AD1A99A|nr:DUF6665 family protein [Rhizobium sp. YJ-22]MBN9030384.1 hypothetical protein [Hyphomicrobiales bacterium]MDG3579185.1 hypothetical protein [Rhizobium sp. YJ-22]
MTVRPPRNFTSFNLTETGLGILEYELMSERASTLGRHGVSVEAALAALAAGEAKELETIEQERLVDKAAQAVWAFFIHREVCGLRNGRDVIQRYGIPGKVLARLGASPRHGSD